MNVKSAHCLVCADCKDRISQDLQPRQKLSSEYRLETRMHSSRMRTVRYSGRLRGGGCLPGGVCLGGVCLGGGCLPGGKHPPLCGQNS